MKHNIGEVVALQPDYLGFIFYEKSPRNFEGSIPNIPSTIKKVGIFVNEDIDVLLEKVRYHKLDAIQLHGEEPPKYCKKLQEKCHVERTLPIGSQGRNLSIWKAFSVDESFDFNQLTPYENEVDKFLFDTKGKNKGGNGVAFNWEILQKYPSKKPFILSGGIGLEDVGKIHTLLQSNLPIYALDLNSKFEIRPGLKNSTDLKQFIDEL